jgi:hypothetical protein
MRSRRTAKFKQQLNALPIEIRRTANAAYRLFTRDPYHTSLHFKRIKADEPIYSVRIGLYYRALGNREEADLIVWFWIGPHSEYDKLIE